MPMSDIVICKNLARRGFWRSSSPQDIFFKAFIFFRLLQMKTVALLDTALLRN